MIYTLTNSNDIMIIARVYSNTKQELCIYSSMQTMKLSDVFHTQPGKGRSYNYSPIGLNTSLKCSVIRNGLTLSKNEIFEIPNGTSISSGSVW